MANRTDHDDAESHTGDDENAASIKLFPHRSADETLSKPLLELLFRLPEDACSPSLLEIEVQHDDWKFFDIQGHLWSLEIKHGRKGHRLVRAVSVAVPLTVPCVALGPQRSRGRWPEITTAGFRNINSNGSDQQQLQVVKEVALHDLSIAVDGPMQSDAKQRAAVCEWQQQCVSGSSSV